MRSPRCLRAVPNLLVFYPVRVARGDQFFPKVFVYITRSPLCIFVCATLLYEAYEIALLCRTLEP
jgi:hypothetical protein